MLSFREPRHGRLITITGPVLSGKTTKLERLLNSAYGIIWNKRGRYRKNVVLAKHPRDDVEHPGRIAGYPALETDNPDDIANIISTKTEAVIISGINFFEDPKIVNLVQDLVMSNRQVYAAGHNLDWEGSPFIHMPQIMALSDGFEITNAPCMAAGCKLPATRSLKASGKGRRVCIDHHRRFKKPEFLQDQTGGLELFVGSMFASKTTAWREKMRELKANEIDYEVFKWVDDKRCGEQDKEYELFGRGLISMHNSDETIPAVIIRNAQDIMDYLDGKTGTAEVDAEAGRRRLGHVFIDEGQFIDGLYAAISERVYRGYKFYVTGLLRNYRMEPFSRMANLLTISDRIEVMHGYCEDCGLEASDSQRFVKKEGKWEPAHYNEDDIAVGDKEEGKGATDRYEARCKDCMEIPGRPGPVYDFPEH